MKDGKIYINVEGGQQNFIRLIISIEGENGKINWFSSQLDDIFFKNGERLELMSHMERIAFTYAKKLNPNIKTIEAYDECTFLYFIPALNKYDRMNVSDYELAYYQKSYYHRRYGAKLKGEEKQKRYEEGIKGLTDPLKKPKEIQLNPIYNQEGVDKIYERTTTWASFFNKLRKEYKDQTLMMLSPWLRWTIRDLVDSSWNFWIFSIENQKNVEILEEKEEQREEQRTMRYRIREEASYGEILNINWDEYFESLKQSEIKDSYYIEDVS